MNAFQKSLTIILLLLTGVLAGIILMQFQNGNPEHQDVQVHVTEVQRSSEPPDRRSDDEFQEPTYRFNNVSEDVTPAVVYVESDVSTGGGQPEDHPELEEDFWDRFMPEGRQRRSIGSGVIITPDGYILTNNHVIGDSYNNLTVGLHDRRSYEAEVVGRDPSTDLAVLKIDEQGLTTAVIGDSDHLQVGDWVMAIGNPFELRSTVTAGIVSAKGRDVQIIDDQMRIENFIQTDAAINQGNSGGALVNTHGELVGINTAIATESGSYQGYGFAIPINMAFKIARDIIEHGEVQRGFLGVQIETVYQEHVDQLGMEEIRGVAVVDVVEHGSAYEGGLQADDVILRVNNNPVNAANELQTEIAMMEPGDRVSLTYWRDGEELQTSFELKGQEDERISEWLAQDPGGSLQMDPEYEQGLERRDFDHGFTAVQIPRPDDLDSFDYIVTRVENGSQAWQQGLRPEMEIRSVDGHRPADLEEIQMIMDEIIRQNGEVEVTVEHQGETTTMVFD